MSADAPCLPDAPESPELEKLLEELRTKFALNFEKLTLDERTLFLLSITDMRRVLDDLIIRRGVKNPLRELPLWAKVWPSSLLLGRFLRKFDLGGKNLLEIGAGCGASGLIAACYGCARVLLSDINEDALLFARANVLKNKLEDRVEVRRVDICASGLEERFDFILASEILYLEELHRPLLKFFSRRLMSGGKALLCTDAARMPKRFLKSAAAAAFAVSEHKLGVRSTDMEGREERRLYLLHVLERL